LDMPRPEQIDSKIIIDTSYYYELYADELPEFVFMDITAGDKREFFQCPSLDSSCPLKRCWDDHRIEKWRTEKFKIENREALITKARTEADFDEDRLALLPKSLPAFLLHSRKWRK
jgi:hypothetical protein